MRKRAAWRAIAPAASLKPPGATGSDPGSSGPKKKRSALLPTRATPIAGWTATDATRTSGSLVGGVVDGSLVVGVVDGSLVVAGVVDGWLVVGSGGLPDDGGGSASSVQPPNTPPP